MKIYNQSKTKVLTECDLTKGYLQLDTIINHIPAIEETKEQFHYEILRRYPNGGTDEKKIIDVPGVKAQAAHDEIEEIQVYIPYTQQQLENIEKEQLRLRRINLLNAFDKWEKAVLRNREIDDPDVMEWFQDLLDLKDEAFENIPNRIEYYL